MALPLTCSTTWEGIRCLKASHLWPKYLLPRIAILFVGICKASFWNCSSQPASYQQWKGFASFWLSMPPTRCVNQTKVCQPDQSLQNYFLLFSQIEEHEYSDSTAATASLHVLLGQHEDCIQFYMMRARRRPATTKHLVPNKLPRTSDVVNGAVYQTQAPWRTRLFLHVCVKINVHTYIHTCMHACMHTYIHTYILTCMHIHIHTYIHICVDLEGA